MTDCYSRLALTTSESDIEKTVNVNWVVNW
jgi:hypothetical protein